MHNSKKCAKKYYIANREKLSRKAHMYYILNKDTIIKRSKKYEEDNKEVRKEYRKDYYIRNREKLNPPRYKKCILCSNTFISKSGIHKLCSDKCKLRAGFNMVYMPFTIVIPRHTRFKLILNMLS